MNNIKIGWSQPTKTEDTLSDGSKVYGVFISGDYDIQIHCVTEQDAENLINVWEHSVIGLEISRYPLP